MIRWLNQTNESADGIGLFGWNSIAAGVLVANELEYQQASSVCLAPRSHSDNFSCPDGRGRLGSSVNKSAVASNGGANVDYTSL